MKSLAITLARPSLMVLIICGVTRTPDTCPFSSTSIPAGATKVSSSTPSATAASISAGRAVISATRRRYTMLTFFAPRRMAVRTASMDTFPPPITATSCPVRSGQSPRLTFLRKPTAEVMPSASSLGSPSFLSVEAPTVISTASYTFLS